MTAYLLDELSDIIGIDSALRLCHLFGGVSYYIPQNPKPGHRWAAALDDNQWAQICARYGGGPLTLPQGESQQKRSRIDELLNEGRLSHRNIAITTGATERYVRQRLQLMKQAERQNLPLFDGLGA